MKLSEAAHAQVKELAIIANHYQQMLLTMQRAIEKIIQDDTGIDVSASDWEVNADEGEVSDRKQQ